MHLCCLLLLKCLLSEVGDSQVHILKKENCISYMCMCIRCVSWTVVTICIIEKPWCTGFYTIYHDSALLTMWLLFWINNSISINDRENLCMISGFRHEADENCVLLGYYTASSSNCLTTYQDNLSVPSSRVKNPIGSPETLIRNYHYLLHNNPEECSS